MLIGIVQFFDAKKGYGYIRVPESRQEYYVHKKQLKTPVKKGDQVSFQIGEDKNGLYACNVKPINDPL